MSELQLQGGGKHLALQPPPPEDSDSGLPQMLEILTTMHTEFFRRVDADEANRDVADVFDQIRSGFPTYPPCVFQWLAPP